MQQVRREEKAESERGKHVLEKKTWTWYGQLILHLVHTTMGHTIPTLYILPNSLNYRIGPPFSHRTAIQLLNTHNEPCNKVCHILSQATKLTHTQSPHYTYNSLKYPIAGYGTQDCYPAFKDTQWTSLLQLSQATKLTHKQSPHYTLTVSITGYGLLSHTGLLSSV